MTPEQQQALMDVVDHTATTVVRSIRRWSAIDWDTAYGTAWGHAAEMAVIHVHETGQTPTVADLARSTTNAVQRERWALAVDRGMGKHSQVYWQHPDSLKARHPETEIVRDMAVHQVLDALPDHHRTIIEQVAEHGLTAAGKMRQETPTTTRWAFHEARTAFLDLWFDGQETRHVEAPVQTCLRGHERTPTSVDRWNNCRRCKAEDRKRWFRERKARAEAGDPAAQCTEPGCTNPYQASGLCGTHSRHRRMERRKEQVTQGDLSVKCTEEGCTRPRDTKGLCSAHYLRLLRQQGRLGPARSLEQALPHPAPAGVPTRTD